MEDIYSDLDNYESVNDAEKIQAENAELKFKIEAITHELEKLREDYDKLHIDYKKLETNYSSLLKTAKAEIERKTQLITTLNTEKDQLVFRYLSTNRYPPYKKMFNEKPNYHEKDCRNDDQNTESEKSLKRDLQIDDNDKCNKKTKGITDNMCQNTELNKGIESKNIKDKSSNVTQRRKSMLESRSTCYASFSSEDEAIDISSDKNSKKKFNKESNSFKHSHDYTKRNYDKLYRDEFRTRLPRDSRGSRNKYENRERYSTHKYRQWEDWHYPNRNKETSPKFTRHYNRDENRKDKEINSKATRYYNFDIREENRNKEMSPKPIRHCNFETNDNRNKETSPKPTRHYNFETNDNRIKEMSPRLTRHYNLETNNDYRNKEMSPKPTRYCNFESNDDNRNKETSPKPTQHYNFETRDESHRKSRRDEQDNNVQNPPNGTRQRCSSRYRQHQEHHPISKNSHTNNVYSEKDELHNKRFETLCEENEDGRNGKRKLKDECDVAPTNKRRRDDEMVAVNIPQNDVETPMDVTFLSSEVVRSPDEETIESVSIKGCTVLQVNEIKLVDPRLTSEKYVQIIDMNNRTSLSTTSGRDIELKVLHYEHTENINCTPSSSKSSNQFSEDFTKEIYESINRQVSNLSPEPGEIIECLDLVSIHINNDGYLKKIIESERIIESGKKITNSESKYLKSKIQTVEDDLELSEDSCDNDHNPKNRNKSRANESVKKCNLKQKTDKEVKECAVIEISGSVNKNQMILNAIHMNKDISESNSSKNEVMNMGDVKEQDKLITLEDLNVKSQNLCSDSSCIQNFTSVELHLSNANMITELHDLNAISNIENCNTDHALNNVDTRRLKRGMNTSENEKDNNDIDNCKNESHGNVINTIAKFDDKKNSKKQEQNNHSAVNILHNIDTLEEDIVHKNSTNDNEFGAENQDNAMTLDDISAAFVKIDNKMCGDISADVTKKTNAVHVSNENKSKQNVKSVKDSKLSDNTNKRKSRTKKENSNMTKDTNKITENVNRRNKDVTHEKSNSVSVKIKDCNDLEKTNKRCNQNDEGRKLNESTKLCESFVKNDENVSLIVLDKNTKDKKVTGNKNGDDDIMIVQETNDSELQTEISTNIIQSTHRNSTRKKSETKTCSNIANSLKSNRISKEKPGNPLDLKAKPKKGVGKKAKNNTESTSEVENMNTSLENKNSSKGNVNIAMNTAVSNRELGLSGMVNFTDKLTLSTETNVCHDEKNVDRQSRIDGNIVRTKKSDHSEFVESKEMSFRTSTPTPMTEQCNYSPKLIIDLADNANSPHISGVSAKEHDSRDIQSVTSDLDLSQDSNKESEAPVVRIFVPRKTSKQRKKISVS